MPAPKNYIKIQYPRKCDHCNHIANSQPAYFYHQKKHQSIPEGTLCDYGCGCLASVITIKGVYICSKVFQTCPAYKDKQSKATVNQWANNDKRKEEASKRFSKIVKKGDRPDKKEYNRYAACIRARGIAWAHRNGFNIGFRTYHVDHKFSISDGWKYGISIDVMSNPANLQILEARQNLKKSKKSSITLDELMNLLNEITPSA